MLSVLCPSCSSERTAQGMVGRDGEEMSEEGKLGLAGS